MKLLLVLFTCLVASNASNVGRYGNNIDNLIKAALEYIRFQLETYEPLEVPQIPDQIINDPDTQIYLNATLNNVFVSDASNFEVRKIENDLDDFWGKFEVFLPSLNGYGDYSIVGNALGKDVKGSGTFTVSISNLDVSGFLQMMLVDHAVQIQYMNLTYTIEDLKFSISGLTVEGVTPEELQNLLNTATLQFFKDNEPLVCEKISRQVTIEGNQIMAGKTLLEIIQWLKDFIGSTTPSPAELL